MDSPQPYATKGNLVHFGFGCIRISVLIRRVKSEIPVEFRFT